MRYTWDAPNPGFPAARLPRAQPLSMVLPAHYLKQFHKKYQDEAKLEELIKENKVKKWARLHIDMSRQYRPENPDLPTLDPWRNTDQAAGRAVHLRAQSVSSTGSTRTAGSCPISTAFMLNVSSSSIIPAKTGAGESDLQGTGIDFADYTFLKDAEKRYPIKVASVEAHAGLAHRAVAQPQLQPTRSGGRCCGRARSAAPCRWRIDRREINMAVFFGLAQGSADTVLPESPLYRPEYAQGLDRPSIPPRPMRCSTRSGLEQARR